MGKGTLTVYSASAGSGKTFRLTGIYLQNLFKSRYNYRRILAVTFTNKATAEMKSRILDNLSRLAEGEMSEYLPDLITETNKPEEWIRHEAGMILNTILQDFSRFSVSTIDSFFQKVLRSFTREMGIHSGYNIELDHSIILSSAVDEMIESASKNIQLKNWLTVYALNNIGDEKSWNLKEGIDKLAQELFKEKFKILSESERLNLQNKEFLNAYIEKIRFVSTSIEKKMVEYGNLALMIFSSFNLSDEMFYQKGKGVPKFIKSLASGNVPEPNRYVREALNDPPRWSTGLPAPQLRDAIENGLEGILREAISYYDENIITWNSSRAVLSYVFALGILSDVLYNVHKITSSENTFLLSDAGDLLMNIIGGDQSPFIYEKVGTRYENFMIDEFQDTSIIQWKNFKPLIDDSMAGGFDNLVVGDVKQSIYRWRNSDWKILGLDLVRQAGNDRIITKPLKINWRSHSKIIGFNNALFTIIPGQIDLSLSEYELPVSFAELYSEAIQVDLGKKPGGYIRLEFIENDKEKNWKESVLGRLPGIIEACQDKGYSASDIGIIVRDGKEGAQVLKTIIDYFNSSSELQKKKYNYNVVSNDSLLLSNSPVINFIISVISFIDEPSDMISRAAMLRYYLLAKGDREADKAPLTAKNLEEVSRNYFPANYEALLEKIRLLPLFEAIESIIRFFGLGDFPYNVAYLNTFQDLVISFAGNKNPDIQSFLDWWKSTGVNKSVVLPVNQDSVRVLTIHKSKGLEFKIVILPFLSWNLDHIPSKQPVLWVKPSVQPFNELGIVPVRYSRDLNGTIFADYYREEKYSVYLDNINLLYVALTRAKDAIYGFSVSNPGSDQSIAGILKNAITADRGYSEKNGIDLHSYYDDEKNLFEYGEIPGNIKRTKDNLSISSSEYKVNQTFESLKLKLHGQNYFSSENAAIREKINYGKLMHEVFEGINSPSDIPSAVNKLVLEGKLPREESVAIERKIIDHINASQVSDWFMPGNKVMTEAGILLTSGNTRRPDRIIFKEGKTVIIDFKFGEENNNYLKQVEVYRHLLSEMGYNDIEGFIWYVDKDKIVSA